MTEPEFDDNEPITIPELPIELNQNDVDVRKQSTREIELRDLTALHPILESWIKDPTSGGPLHEEIIGVLAAIEGSISQQNDRTYVVAEDINGKITGMMGMARPSNAMNEYITTAHPVEFINAYVDHHSVGSGTGRALAHRLEEIAKQNGNTEIIVNSGPRYKETGWGFWTKLYGAPVAIRKDLYGTGLHAQVWRKKLQVN